MKPGTRISHSGRAGTVVRRSRDKPEMMLVKFDDDPVSQFDSSQSVALGVWLEVSESEVELLSE